MKDLPLQERPRERLAEKGAASLSSIELIAILLGNGTRESSALDLAAELLMHFGSLEHLADTTIPELCSIKGIGLAKAVRLHAAFALHKRIKVAPSRPIIDTPAKAFTEIDFLAEEKTEVLLVLLRDARRGLLHKEIIGRGTLNQLLVHPREVFSLAIKLRAHSLLIAHNHPSGDPSPSISDITLTQNLKQVAQIVGIPLVDHIVVGGGRFYSFWEKGIMDRKEY